MVTAWGDTAQPDGRHLGPAVRDLLTIVDYRSYLRWVRTGGKPQRSERRAGRPPVAAVIVEIALRIGRETRLGYGAILGDLRRLGHEAVSRRTVGYVLRRHGIHPAPDRAGPTWTEFLRTNAPTLLVSDFFSKRTFSLRTGFRTFYTLFFLHVGSRRVLVSGATGHPDAAWMSQQARNLSLWIESLPKRPKRILRDRDTKFTRGFDAILCDEGVETVRTPFRNPNLNAYAESWVATVKRECLDHFWLPSPTRLRRVLREYETYYNDVRPHSALRYRAPTHDPKARDPTPAEPGEVISRTWCAGLIRSYHKRAG